ncbi:hypothetical protein GGU10DRAFT_434468 [Lentinula aff. detonsa]|uniref:Uncharacterized protein n=1 Tax=Lentinula aff. detonsa TaxID=2804958 RepID=A0AA38NPL8_9AGAR|nr:hypothetical protein GGU10DRAFT_434468 [Lentinula aff. detonsa]
MHYSQLLKALFGAGLALSHVTASPIPTPDLENTVLGKRATIQLFHVTSTASATSIQHGGVKLQVKTSAAGHLTGDDFNPMNTGGFYVTDNKEAIIEWCKGRNIGSDRAKTNCAELITFNFDDSVLSDLKYHKFTGPATGSKTDLTAWMNATLNVFPISHKTPDFEQWNEFVTLCTHGGEPDEEVPLAADLADGGKALDLVIGPMEANHAIRQYAFRTTKGLGHLKVASVTSTGVQ